MTNPDQRITIGHLNAGGVTFGDNSPVHYGGQPDSVPGGRGPDGPAAAPHKSGGAPRDHSKLLLIVVTPIELEATIRAVTAASGAAFTRSFVRHHTIYSLGRIGRTEVTLAQVAQGAQTPDAAAAATPALIEAVRPDFVILVGICYGLRGEDVGGPQCPGDVLVANQLLLAAHRRVADVDTERGGAVHPSPMLLDRFRTTHVDWPEPAAVYLGPLVSESVLVNSVAYRASLRQRFPEAIGGEMEAAGVYPFAMRANVEWGVVKAICDFGAQKTDEHHRRAAENAASFLTHMVSIGGLDPVPATA